MGMSEINDYINRLEKELLDTLFPRHCPFCGKLLDKGLLLCPACQEKLPLTGDKALRQLPFGMVAAPLYYDEMVRRGLLDYKFKGHMDGLPCFGRLMAQCAAEQFSGGFDVVTWVPVSRKRLRKRGFDQSRYLAGSLCEDWHTTVLETLRKPVDNPPQSSLTDPAERRANVLGRYEPVKPERFRGLRLLLVDDVCTTGATLTECARVLYQAGAAGVVGLTLAMVREE